MLTPVVGTSHAQEARQILGRELLVSVNALEDLVDMEALLDLDVLGGEDFEDLRARHRSAERRVLASALSKLVRTYTAAVSRQAIESVVIFSATGCTQAEICAIAPF
jgi:hypothetical protein